MTKTIKKHTVKGCCDKQALIWETNFPFFPEYENSFKNAGFEVLQNYIKKGIFYIENDNLIITVAFGSNELTIKCKTKDCTVALEDFESFLNTL